MDLFFSMRIEHKIDTLKASSLEPNILKLLSSHDPDNPKVSFSQKSLDDETRKNFLFKVTTQHIKHRLNYSSELIIKKVENDYKNQKIKEGCSAFSVDGFAQNLTVHHPESEEVGLRQRREHTIRTDVRTESEWFGINPSKEITFEIGSEDPLRQKKQLENVFKVDNHLKMSKFSLGKRSDIVLEESEKYQKLSSINRLHNNPQKKIKNLNISKKNLMKIISPKNKKQLENKLESVNIEHSKKCVICFEEKNAIRGVLDCDHSYCYCCIKKWISKAATCPICKIHPRLIRKFKFNRYIKSEFTKTWNNPLFNVPNQLRSHWVVHEMESENEDVDFSCLKCGQEGDISSMVQCFRCHIRACHMDCLSQNPREVPDYSWLCEYCISCLLYTSPSPRD